jgi:hypothetical protein
MDLMSCSGSFSPEFDGLCDFTVCFALMESTSPQLDFHLTLLDLKSLYDLAFTILNIVQ